MIHSLTRARHRVIAAPLVKNIPLAALAAILMVVAYNMGEWQEIPENPEAQRRRHRRVAYHRNAYRSD